jgi:hypothetical protein
LQALPFDILEPFVVDMLEGRPTMGIIGGAPGIGIIELPPGAGEPAEGDGGMPIMGDPMAGLGLPATGFGIGMAGVPIGWNPSVIPRKFNTELRVK